MAAGVISGSWTVCALCMWSELLEREIFSEDENEKKPKHFSGKGFPAPPFGLFPNCWIFPAAKTFELPMGEGDHCSRSTGGVTGTLCMSLYYQSLGLQKIIDLRLKSKASWRGSVLHIVMSRFHSLKSGAGSKRRGSSMALWEARAQPLHHAEEMKTALPQLSVGGLGLPSSGFESPTVTWRSGPTKPVKMQSCALGFPRWGQNSASTECWV